MWVTPILLMPAILEVSRPGIEFLAFLALIGMIMVGCAPDYARDPFQHKVHISGAVMCIGFSQLWVALNCWVILIPIWLAYLAYTGISIGKQKEGVFLYKFMQTKPMFYLLGFGDPDKPHIAIVINNNRSELHSRERPSLILKSPRKKNKKGSAAKIKE